MRNSVISHYYSIVNAMYVDMRSISRILLL